MKKIKIIALISIVVISLAALAYKIYYNIEKSQPVIIDPPKSDESKKVQLKVVNNTLEVDLRANIIVKKDSVTGLDFEYYSEGYSYAKQLGSSKIPELKLLNATQNTIDMIHLNYKDLSVYFVVPDMGKPNSKKYSFYSVKLKDNSVKKICSTENPASNIYFSSNMDYLAFSYKHKAVDNLWNLMLIDTKTNMLIVNDNNYLNTKKLIGSRDNLKFNFGYQSLGWYTSNVLKLNEVSTIKIEPFNTINQKEIYYDVVQNIFVNKDLTPVEDTSKVLTDPKTSKEKTNQNVSSVETRKVRGETVSVIEEFLGNVNQGQYQKAYDTMDEEFWLNAFGFKSSEPIRKKEIDLQSFSAMYGSILNSTKLKNIVSEKITDDTSEVRFNQLFFSNDQTVVEYHLVMVLKKRSDGWKVHELKDAKE